MKRSIISRKSVFHVLLIAALFGVFVSAFSQVDHINSEQKSRRNYDQDTSEINRLNKLAFQNINTNSLQTGIEYASKAIRLAQNANYQKGLADAYQALGLYYHFSNSNNQAIFNYQNAFAIWELLGDSVNMARQSNFIGSMYHEMAVYDTALIYFTKSLGLLKNLNDSIELANTYNNIGLIYNSQGKLNKSLENLIESLRLWQCVEDEIKIGLTYSNIGMVYRRLGEYEKAIDYLHKTIDIEDKLEMPEQIIESYIQIGIIYEETGKYNEALKNYQKGLKIARQLNHKTKIAGCLNNIGVVYYDMRNFNLALDYYFESLEIKQEIGDKHGITVTTINIAEAYIDLAKSNLKSNPEREIKYFGSQNSIISLLTASVKIAKETRNYQDLSNTYSTLISFNSEFENYEEAVKFQDKLMALTDSLYNIDNDREVAKLRAKLENEKKVQKIALLDTKNTAQISQLKRQNIQRYIFMGGGISLVLIILGLINRLIFIRKSQNELQAKNHHIQQEKIKAEQSERIKEKFLANMSHEIRTPMNSILGMTNIMRKNEHLKSQEKYLDAIAQSSDNLLVILNDILDLSNLEAGKIEIEKKLFNLHHELRNVEEILKFKAREKGIKLKCAVKEGVPEWVVGDPTRLNQVLMNLLGNAIKFTEKGGVNGLVQLKEQNKNQVLLEFVISDSGIGISPDRLDAIFKSFTQADGNTTRHYGGTGLGLTISKQLVELQKGQISVKSKLGEGSQFIFEIPYEMGTISPKEQVEQLKDYSNLNSIRILVAEDNEFNAMVLLEELKTNIQNSIVDIASNGKIALEKVLSKRYDVILMDIQMPEMDGYTVSKAIRNSNNEGKNIPIIAMTASTMKSDIEMCFESGMNEFISKPFKTEDLLEKIERLVHKNKP